VIGNWYQLAITNIDSDELLSDLVLHFIDQQQVEIGFILSPKFQQRKLATEAVLCLLSYLFAELKILRVIVTTDTRNTAAKRLLEKTGFRQEAHFVKNIFFKGVWSDEYQYALLGADHKFDSTADHC